MDDKKYSNSIITLICAVALWYVLSGGISDNRAGIEQARRDIDAVRQQQQSAAKQLETVADRIERSAGAVTIIERRIEADQRIITSNNELTREGKSIINTVRQRH